jgi:hypothetical protein
MKTLVFSTSILASALFTLLTAAQPVAAQEDSTSRSTVEEVAPPRLRDMGMHINPQIGVSSFEYSGTTGGAKQKLSGGATTEFGLGMRRLETGLLLMQAGGRAELRDGSTQNVTSTYLTIPMMAKIRIMQMQAQSWYIKTGVLTAFEVASSRDSATNNIDVLASLGLGGRFAFTRTADFIVEATYNRGLIEAARTTAASTDYNQGVIVLAGVSFSI